MMMWWFEGGGAVGLGASSRRHCHHRGKRRLGGIVKIKAFQTELHYSFIADLLRSLMYCFSIAHMHSKSQLSVLAIFTAISRYYDAPTITTIINSQSDCAKIGSN